MLAENNPSSTRSHRKWEFFMYPQYSQSQHHASLRDQDLILNSAVMDSTLTGIDYRPLFRDILFWGRWLLDIPSMILPPSQAYNFKLYIKQILYNKVSQLEISETIFTKVITTNPPPPRKKIVQMRLTASSLLVISLSFRVNQLVK